MATNHLLEKLSRYPIGTYADIIYRHALLNGNNVAFIYGKERVTFAEYNARVNSLVHALQSMSVKKGDVIGILFMELYGICIYFRGGDERWIYRLAVQSTVTGKRT